MPGERTVTVPPLSLVGSDGTAGSDAEALFLDRARATDPGFAATPAVVGKVCARLDGVPLAIELAAARSASLGVDGLLAGLDDHLRLLAGSRGSQQRHRSLRAVIDWSHDLLDDDERTAFRRARRLHRRVRSRRGPGRLAGRQPRRGRRPDRPGCTDKSLLTHRLGPEGSRWQMLETIRAYALDRLAASGEEAAVREAHLRWAAAVADDLEHRAETGRKWRGAFDTVADDLRAALARSDSPGTEELGHRLARSLGHLAYARRFMVEAREHYLAAATLAAGPGQAATDLRAAADVAMAEGRNAVAFDLLLASAERAGSAGDCSAQAAALAYAATIADRFAAGFPEEIPPERLRQLIDEAARVAALDPVGTAYLKAAVAWTAQPEKTIPDPNLSHDALAAARLAGDPVLISGALDAVVVGLDAGGRIREAHQRNKERAQLLARMPRHDPRAGVEIVDTIHMVTAIAVTAGDLPDALATARLALDDDIATGQPHVAASKLILPLVLQGKFEEAAAQAAVMWETWQQAGRPAARWLGPAVYGMVLANGVRGDGGGRQEWLARLGELAGTRTDYVEGTNLAAAAAFTEARICLYEGRIDAAMAAVAGLRPEAENWYGMPHWHSPGLMPGRWRPKWLSWPLPDAASWLTAAAPAGEENYWAAACLARAARLVTGDRGALEQSLAGGERIEARFEYACTLLLLDDRAAEGHAGLRALGCQPPAAGHR